MAKPTYTRQALRQLLCSELNMPFYRLFPAPQACDTMDATSLADDELSTFNDDYWNNTWLLTSTGVMRLVSDFTSSDSKVHWGPAATPIASSDTYELLSIFSPAEIHTSINRAIQSSFPNFFDTAEDSSIVIQEEKVMYDLSALTLRPWSVTSVLVEDQADRQLGKVTSATATTFVDSAADFSNVKAGWMVTIYSGTGAGQVRTIKTDATGEVTVAWVNQPDTTSKYCLWNALETRPWRKTLYATFDTKEYPSALYLPGLYSQWYGARIKLEFICKPPDLAADTEATPVPPEYIVNKAAAILFSKKMNDNRVDRQRYQQLAAKYEQDAVNTAQRDRFNLPEQSLWQDYSDASNDPLDDPMGWSS